MDFTSTTTESTTTDAWANVTSTTEVYDNSSRANIIAQDKIIVEKLGIIHFYTIMFQCVIGLIGNSASLAVWIAGEKSSALASSNYFKFLSATDVFSLVYRLIAAMGQPPVNASFMETEGMFIVDCFLFFFVPQLSTWVVVCLTVERTLSLCFPLKFHTKGAGRRAKISFVSILVFLTCINSVRAVRCLADSELLHDIYTEVMKLSAIYLLCILPVVIITTCNIIVICRLCMQKQIGASDSRRQIVTKFTRLSIGAGILQCVSILPILVYNIHLYYRIPMTQLNREGIHTFQYICDIVLYLNNTFNFVVYSFSSRDFRIDFKEMFCCKH